MELPENIEALYRELMLKKYKGTLTEEEALIFADLTDRRNRIDVSTTGVSDLPPELVRYVNDLSGFAGTMEEMAGKITHQESRHDLAQLLQQKNTPPEAKE